MATQNSINNTGQSLSTTTTIIAGTGATVTSGNLIITAGNLTLPTTSSTVGLITIGGTRYLHASGATSVFLGPNAGNFTTTASNNIGIGNQALDAVTTGVGENIGIGTNAGGAITSGTYNIGIGTSSCGGFATRIGNIGIGYLALSGSVATDYNIGIGYQALKVLNGAGDQCVAIGYNCLTACTTGIGCTGLGYQAGLNSTTSSYSTLVGSSTGQFTTGTGSTFVGYQAGYGTGTGLNYQTGIGFKSLYAATTGASGNTALGANSLIGVATGTFNVGIGTLSTTTGGGSALTTNDSGNIAIGHVGVAGSNNFTWIGTSQTSCYIAGIYNQTVGATAGVAIVDSTNKLGSLSAAAGQVLVSGTAPSFTASPTVTTMKATTFDTNVAAAALNLVGTTLSAVGSDTDINVNITPKGVGTIVSTAVYAKAVGGTNRAMLVDDSGLIGNATSSRKFKENIRDMGDDSSPLMSLRPVTFNYKSDENKRTKFGLIAEEVAEVMPGLVSYDENGEPYTVSYHEMPSLLLNELQKRNKMIQELYKRIDLLEHTYVHRGHNRLPCSCGGHNHGNV